MPHTTLLMPPAKHCPPYATCLTPPSPWVLQLSKSLECACRKIHGNTQSSEIRSVLLLESVLASDLQVYLGPYLEEVLGASRELTREHIVKQAGSVQSSAMGSVLESMPRSGHQNILRGVLGSVLEFT